MATFAHSPEPVSDRANGVANGPGRLRRARPQPGIAGLPHPSWRRAIGGASESDGSRLASASEFWERLGI